MTLDKDQLLGVVKAGKFTAKNLQNGNHLAQSKGFTFNINGLDLNLLQLCAHFKCEEAVKNLIDAKIDNVSAYEIFKGDGAKGTLPFQLALRSNSTKAANDLLTKMKEEKGAAALEGVKLDFNGLDGMHISKIVKNVYDLGIEMKVTIFPDGDIAGPLHLFAANEAICNGLAHSTLEKAVEINKLNEETSFYRATPLDVSGHKLNFKFMHYAMQRGADIHHKAMDGWNVLHFTINAKDQTGASQFPCLKELVEVADKEMWGYSAKIYPGTIWAGHLFPSAEQGETHTALEFFDAFIAQHPNEGYNTLLEAAHNMADIPLAGDAQAGSDMGLYA